MFTNVENYLNELKESIESINLSVSRIESEPPGSRTTHPLVGISSLLDVIYGAIFSYVIYDILTHIVYKSGEMISGNTGLDYTGIYFHGYRLYFLILLLAFFVEDYISVKFINNLKRYGSISRFSLDLAIAFFFVLSFHKIIVNKYDTKYFLVFLFVIYLIGILWVIGLQNRNSLRNLNNKKYLNLTLWVHILMMIVIGVLYAFGPSNLNTLYKCLFWSFIFIHVFFGAAMRFFYIFKFEGNFVDSKRPGTILLKESGAFTSRLFLNFCIIIFVMLKSVWDYGKRNSDPA